MTIDSGLNDRLQNLLQKNLQSQLFIRVSKNIVKVNIRLKIVAYCSLAMLSL